MHSKTVQGKKRAQFTNTRNKKGDIAVDLISIKGKL